jgi:hypothetical protein
VWFRFRRALEYTPTILLVLERESNAKSCASLVLQLRAQGTTWSQTSASIEGPSLPHSPGCLLDGWKSHAEMIRSHANRENHRSIRQNAISVEARDDGADFKTQISWNDLQTSQRSAGGAHRKG